jgi:hypothetical protein
LALKLVLLGVVWEAMLLVLLQRAFTLSKLFLVILAVEIFLWEDRTYWVDFVLLACIALF